MTILNKGYFDVRRDGEVINAGGFFCQACLVSKSGNEQSPDKRYCQGCYDFLLEEAKMMVIVRRKRPEWIPVRGLEVLRKPAKEVAQVSDYMRNNMSTVNGQKAGVDIIQPSVAEVGVAVRGPKPRDLPEDLIEQLASQGMGSKAIATRLKAEGIVVSYKTIQRRLQGVLV